MAGIRVEGGEELQRKVATMADRLRASIAGGLNEIGKDIEKKLKAAVSNRALRRRSGALARSIGYVASETTVEVGVIKPEDGNVLEYAKKQDTGGLISAKSARFRIQNIKGKPLVGPFLRIPVGDNLTKAGVDRGLSGFYIRGKSGNYVGVKPINMAGSGDDVEVINVLKSSVFINRSGWFSDTIVDALPVAQNFLRARIQRVLEGVA